MDPYRAPPPTRAAPRWCAVLGRLARFVRMPSAERAARTLLWTIIVTLAVPIVVVAFALLMWARGVYP